jgi:hypothetical protein
MDHAFETNGKVAEGLRRSGGKRVEETARQLHGDLHHVGFR